MTPSALILTYHAVEPGPPPLHLDPSLFAEHLAVLEAEDATVLTVAQLVAKLRDGVLPERAVAMTFDDGADSVARNAAPLLADRGYGATVYCVAGHLGGSSAWSTLPPETPTYRLADAGTLRALIEAGLEIGSHGVEHAPLGKATDEVGRRELVDSKTTLEDLVQAPVTTFALPYGSLPGPSLDVVLRATYDGACAVGPGRVLPHTDPYRLARVDAHYVRRPGQLRAVLPGSRSPYLQVRRAGARMRRLVRHDYAEEQP
jgi:peptidoglycan/xylan/chitin deacetylase (PgdA/CDA1 family)